MRKTAMILVHDDDVGAGSIPLVLQDLEYSIDFRFSAEDEIHNTIPDLLVVMGGQMGVYEADQYPFLHRELDILRKRIADDKPTLGICLGAQLIAKALGAEVYKGPQGKEIGWHDLYVNEEGRKHPVRHLDHSVTKVMQWHGDTFDMPKNARLLASSDKYKKQAIAHGKNVLGLQGHPEVTEEVSRRWIARMDESELTVPGETMEKARARLIAETKTYNDTLLRQMRLFLTEWLKSIGLA